MNAAYVLNQRIAKSFCFRPLTDVLVRKSNAPPGGAHLSSNSHCTELNVSQMPGDFPGGMGGFGIDWYIIYQKRETVLQRSIFDEIRGAWIADETL